MQLTTLPADAPSASETPGKRRTLPKRPLLLPALAVLAAGGAGYYFKVYRTKQVHEDYDEGGEYEEIPEEEYDDSPPWDEDGEADADEGGGDE